VFEIFYVKSQDRAVVLSVDKVKFKKVFYACTFTSMSCMHGVVVNAGTDKDVTTIVAGEAVHVIDINRGRRAPRGGGGYAGTEQN